MAMSKIRQRPYVPTEYSEGQRLTWGEGPAATGIIVGPGPKPASLWVVRDEPDVNGERWAVVSKPSKRYPRLSEAGADTLPGLTVDDATRLLGQVHLGLQLHVERVSLRRSRSYGSTESRPYVHISRDCSEAGREDRQWGELTYHDSRFDYRPKAGYEAYQLLLGKESATYRGWVRTSAQACPCLRSAARLDMAA
jgi:hypothetical protein